MSDDLKKRTKAVHAGIRRSQYNEVSEALFLTQGFVYDTAEQAEARFISNTREEFIYARYANPTVAMFEDRIAALEGAEDAFACASGMAAVNGVLMAGVEAGDHIVSARALFGSCIHILENVLGKLGVEVTYVDGRNLEEWKAAIRPDTKMVFFEGVSNPTLEVIDIKGVADLAHAVGALVIVDNVFATPVYSRALELGADVVVYSATKHIDGQGRVLGGVVLGKRDYIRGPFETYMKHTGAAISPFSAWLLLKGLETMELRVRAQNASATVIAKELEGHEKLQRVIYPGLQSHPQHEIMMAQTGGHGSTMLAIDLGSREAAFRFLNALNVCIISNNLGDAKSIATHPATTTHQRLSDLQKETLGISPGLIRISVGLEDPEDLLNDFLQALAQA